MFGSIGFAISAFGMGAFGVDQEVSRPFFVAAVAYGLGSVVAQRLPDTHVPTRAPLYLAIRAMAKKPDVLLLWIASTFYYAAHGAYDVYFGPHVAAIPGIGAEAVSYAWALGVICEVAMLFAVPVLLRRTSSDLLLILSAVVSALRWFLLARASAPWHVWALAPLHAVTFGLWYLSFVHANQAGAPRELRATVQGLAAACLGLGMITATLLGGYVLEHFGGAVLFDLAAGFALLAGLAYLARTHAARSERALAAPASEP